LAALPAPAQAPPSAGRLPSSAAGAAAGHAAPTSSSAVRAGAADEEPVLKAIRQTLRDLRTAWQEAHVATPVKVAILVVILLAVLSTAHFLVTLSIALLLLYGVYRLIRALVLSTNTPTARHQWQPAPPGPSPPTAGQAQAPAQDKATLGRTRPGQRRWYHRERPAPAMVVKSPRQRTTELIGSLLGSALVVMTMCVVTVLLFASGTATPSAQQCAWLLLASLAGTWAVLIPAKFWEGTRGEVALRRFAMMVIGLGLGVLAFAVASSLMVHLPGDADLAFDRDFTLPTSSSFFAENGQPLVMAYMACFGALFLLVRWWRQADPLRVARLSLWSIFVSVAAAWLVAGVLHFPQPWLPMVAGAISVSVQLASPWMPPHQRTRRHRLAGDDHAGPA
jgi:hypothetical protein